MPSIVMIMHRKRSRCKFKADLVGITPSLVSNVAVFALDIIFLAYIIGCFWPMYGYSISFVMEHEPID